MPALEDFWSHGSLIVGLKLGIDKYVRPYTGHAGWLVLVWAAVGSVILAIGRQAVVTRGQPGDWWAVGGAVVVDAIIILTGAVIVTDSHNRAREMATIRQTAISVATNPVPATPAVIVPPPAPIPAPPPVVSPVPPLITSNRGLP